MTRGNVFQQVRNRARVVFGVVVCAIIVVVIVAPSVLGRGPTTKTAYEIHREDAEMPIGTLRVEQSRQAFPLDPWGSSFPYGETTRVVYWGSGFELSGRTTGKTGGSTYDLLADILVRDDKGRLLARITGETRSVGRGDYQSRLFGWTDWVMAPVAYLVEVSVSGQPYVTIILGYTPGQEEKTKWFWRIP